MSVCLFFSTHVYTHTHTYIHSHTHRGVWNAPFITSAFLMSGQWLAELKNDLPSFSSKTLDPDMAFCGWMREHVKIVQFFFILTYNVEKNTLLMVCVFCDRVCVCLYTFFVV